MAIETTLCMPNGESFGYLEEVVRLYDIQPALTDESVYLEAHRELGTLPPGSGSLAERSEVRRKWYELETSQVLSLLELARDCLIRHTTSGQRCACSCQTRTLSPYPCSTLRGNTHRRHGSRRNMAKVGETPARLFILHPFVRLFGYGFGRPVSIRSPAQRK